MKISFLLIPVILSINAGAQTQKAPTVNTSPRIEKVINSNWTFNYFPSESASKGYESATFDDGRWSAISIPHTWNTYETTGEFHPFIMNPAAEDNLYWTNGWGWYRKHFTINRSISGSRVFIEFEGVQKYCKVWINGTYLGDHAGGYGSFDFDVTTFIKQGSDNVIAVAVSNKMNDQLKIPPMVPVHFNVYGGIYRNVKIVIKNNIHIPMQGAASHEGGTFITTPGFTGGSGIVRIQTWVKNDNPQPKNITLQSTILDAAGKSVQVIKSAATVNAGQLYKFDQSSKPVKNPALWSPAKPVLYSVYSEVLDGAQVTDAYLSIFGFRWFRWDEKNKVFYLNNTRTDLKGAFISQDYPWLGNALPGWIIEEDLRDMSWNIGFNFIRTSYYPADGKVYDYADKNGQLVEEGIPVNGSQDFSSDIIGKQIKEMIRRDRNHPSVIFWRSSINSSVKVDPKLILAEDSTRIIAVQDQGGLVPDAGNITAKLIYNPGVQIGGDYGILQENIVQNLVKSGVFSQANQSSWLYNAHGAPDVAGPVHLMHINATAITDIYRFPGYAYHLLKAKYSDEPVLFIMPHYWTQQHTGKKQTLIIITNCEKVELKVNGTVIGANVLTSNDNCLTSFRDVEIKTGKIEANGTWKGKPVNAFLDMPADPAKIILTTNQSKITAERSSVAVVTARIQDAKGNYIHSANNILKWNVSGPAKLAGPDAYVSMTGTQGQSEGSGYLNVPVANIIRSTGEAGRIIITVSATGIASGSVEITAENSTSGNSVIIEPSLRNEGRRAQERRIISGSLEDIPEEIKAASESIKIAEISSGGYKKAIADYIRKNNPSVDTSTVEFGILAKTLATYLLNNNGQITAWDYNFNVKNYNTSRLITSYITATKLPQQFKDGLRAFYAESVIRQGKVVNAGDEMNWLNWIPSGGTVVIYSAGEKITPPKGVLITDKNILADMITLVHPGFKDFSQDAKERAIEFITKMNPFVKQEVLVDADNQGRTYLKAETGKPVLIPLYKFITE